MRPNLRSILFSSRAAAPNASPDPIGGRGPSGWCSNLGSAQQYTGTCPFANLVNWSGYTWSKWSGALPWANPQAATNWVTNMPAGESCDLVINPNHSPVPMYPPPGDYVITSKTGVTCGVNATGVTNVVQGTPASPNAYFTIPDFGPMVDNYVFLEINMKNDTGAMIATVNDVYCGTLLNKASWDAGNWWDLKAAEMVRGSGIIRLGDMMGRNLGTSNRLDVPHPTEANMNWQKFDPDGTLLGRFTLPLSAAVKFCKAINAGVWIVMPSGEEAVFYETDATTNRFITWSYVGYGGPELAPHRYLNGQGIRWYSYNQVCPTPFNYDTTYFVVNATAGDFQLSATAGGVPIALTQTINATTRPGLAPSSDISAWRLEKLIPMAAYVKYFNDVLDEVHAIYPEAQIVVECANESWNPAYSRQYFGQVTAHQLQIELGSPIVNENAGNGGLPYGLDWGAIGYAYLQLLAWKAVEERFGRAQNTRLSSLQATWFNNMMGNLQWKDPGVLNAANTTYYKDIIDGFMIATYIGMDIGYAEAIRANGLNWTDADFLTHFKTGAVLVAQGVQATLDNMAIYAPKAKLYTYESGFGIEGPINNVGTLTNAQLMTFGVMVQTWILNSPLAAEYANFVIETLYHAKGVQNQQHWAAGGWLLDPPGGLEGLSAVRTYQTAPTPYTSAMRTFRKLQ